MYRVHKEKAHDMNDYSFITLRVGTVYFKYRNVLTSDRRLMLTFPEICETDHQSFTYKRFSFFLNFDFGNIRFPLRMNYTKKNFILNSFAFYQ